MPKPTLERKETVIRIRMTDTMLSNLRKHSNGTNLSELVRYIIETWIYEQEKKK